LGIRQIYPMLAVKKDVVKLGYFEDDNWCAQRKYDGERVVDQITKDACYLTGRRTVKVTGELSLKTAYVPHMMLPKTLREFFDETTIDGELLHPDEFHALSKIMRCKPEKAVARQVESGKYLTYTVYDLIEYNGYDYRNKEFKERYETLIAVFKVLKSAYPNITQYYDIAPTAFTTDEKRALYKRAQDEGWEGLIFRRIDAPYEECPGTKHSNFLVKLKEKFEMDVVVMGFESAEMPYTGKDPEKWTLWATPDGNHRYEGVKDNFDNCTVTVDGEEHHEWVPVSYTWFHDLPATVTFGCYKDGVLTERGTCSGYSYEVAKDMKDNAKEWIGNCITVVGYGLMEGTGSLRHPGFDRTHFDKNPEDCIWDAEDCIRKL